MQIYEFAAFSRWSEGGQEKAPGMTTDRKARAGYSGRRGRLHYLRCMILLTGATGMIGARLLYDLVSEGHPVRALRRKDSSVRLFEAYTRQQPQLREKVEWVEGELLEPDSLETALDNVDTVFHCAAMISFHPKDAERMLKVNMEGTANLVNLCLEKAEVRYFAHVSSVATLGRTSGDQYLDENSHWDPSTHPSHYAISKYGAEREVWRGMAEGLTAVIVNPSIVLGPGDWHHGSAALFKKVKDGFPFYTEGVSGFVDVRDVSDALRFLWKKERSGERFILNGEDLSFNTLFRMIAKQLGVKAPSIKVRSWMTALAWPLDALRSRITGGKPFITRETARSARSRFHYSAKKIKEAGFSFRPVEDCIRFTLPFLPD
ncbi:MAG: SDR family oxidoreductase [Bacteroidia bacterium]|nr:SDR family oxidoreductase [Bacteroidia bacterium]